MTPSAQDYGRIERLKNALDEFVEGNNEARDEIERLRAAQVRHEAELGEIADRIEQLVRKGGSGGSLRLRLLGLVSELRDE